LWGAGLRRIEGLSTRVKWGERLSNQVGKFLETFLKVCEKFFCGAKQGKGLDGLEIEKGEVRKHSASYHKRNQPSGKKILLRA